MRLSLRVKIMGGFALVLGLIALLGWVTLSLFSSTRSLQREVLDDAVPALEAIDEIERSYTAQSAAIRGFLIQVRPSLLEQYRSEVEEVKVLEEAAMELFTEARERALLAQLTRAGSRFADLVDERVIPLAEEGRRAQAFGLLGREGTPLISEIERVGSTLREAQGDVVDASRAELRSRSNQTVAILLLVIVGAFGIGLLVAVFLPRQLVANLLRLVEAARAVGRGDLDQRLEIRSGDEVEELAARFMEMQSGLARLQQLALQDRELEIAASIQRNLLQRSLPRTPGLRVTPVQRHANVIGGDWYDVDVSGESLVVAVGDASGKGIGAALMATVVLSVLRAERRLGSFPRRVVERANEALREAADPDSFTTLVYATVHATTGRASWLNMGHPAPFLLKSGSDRDGHFVEGPRNRALGWFENPHFSEAVLRLDPGDRLLFYTDGFLEAKSPGGEMYGERRLGDALSRFAALDASALADELIKEVERFCAGKLDDDLTILVIEFEGATLAQAVPARMTGEEPWHSRR